MAQAGIEFEWIEIDLLNGESRTPEFFAKNPSGKVPLLELAPDRTLAESNAMLVHLGRGTPFWPDEHWQQSKTLEWLFFEQYSHEPHIATVRFWVRMLGKAEAWRKRIAAAMEKGHAALAVMEQRLEVADYFVGDRYGVADIALYAYTHVAHEGGYDLSPYPAIRAWLDRVAAQPDHVPMSPLPEVRA